jgi:hypothetical protein
MTDQHPCVLCHIQSTPAFACYDCRRRMDDQLADLPELYIQAAGEYWATGGESGRGNERSLGLRVAALDGRAPFDTIAVLESWEIDWRESLSTFAGRDPDRAQRERKAERWADSESSDAVGVSLCGVVDFLRIHLEAAAAEHPAIDEFAAELRTLHRQAKAAARISSEPVTVVECPADHPDDPSRLCGKRLRLVADQAECPKCGASWSTSRLLLVASSTQAEVWQPAQTVSLILGVPERTLRHWAQRGHIRRRGSTLLWSSVVAHIEATGHVGESRYNLHA